MAAHPPATVGDGARDTAAPLLAANTDCWSRRAVTLPAIRSDLPIFPGEEEHYSLLGHAEARAVEAAWQLSPPQFVVLPGAPETPLADIDIATVVDLSGRPSPASPASGVVRVVGERIVTAEMVESDPFLQVACAPRDATDGLSSPSRRLVELIGSVIYRALIFDPSDREAYERMDAAELAYVLARKHLGADDQARVLRACSNWDRLLLVEVGITAKVIREQTVVAPGSAKDSSAGSWYEALDALHLPVRQSQPDLRHAGSGLGLLGRRQQRR